MHSLVDCFDPRTTRRAGCPGRALEF
jgi:hypothetical protein